VKRGRQSRSKEVDTMEPDGKSTTPGELSVQFVSGSTTREPGLVFDFTGLHRPELCDLAWILTARLRSGPEERVWVRALPDSTWKVLRAMGLAHLFHVLPGPGNVMN
jgi:hypothetical protein